MDINEIFHITKLDEFINNIIEPVMLYDEKGVLLYSNESAENTARVEQFVKIRKKLTFNEQVIYFETAELKEEKGDAFKYIYSKEVETILNTINDGIYISDSKGFTLLVNDKYAEMTGIAKNEVEGRHISELIFSGYFDSSVTLEVLSKKSKVSVLQKTKDQEKVWLVNGNPFQNENGNIKMIINSVYDMTDLNNLRENLKRQEKINNHQQQEIDLLKSKIKDVPYFIGNSPQIKEIKRKISKISDIDSTVLIVGETGSGKNVIARAIHELRSHQSGPFIEVNCGAIPEHLMESELFGYIEGAFTGAAKGGKAGLIESADKGTLFLDEIGELPLSLQVKLLTFLQDKKVRRVGDVKYRTVNTRVMAATNQKLEELVAERKFREDLYYRLSVVPVVMPPLRKLKEDIELFTEYFLQKYNIQYNKGISINPSIFYYLNNYNWPGNVRELQHLIEQLVVLSEEDVINVGDLPEHIKYNVNQPKVSKQGLQEILDDMEKEIIKNRWKEIPDMGLLAKSFNIHRTTLMRKINKLNITLK